MNAVASPSSAETEASVLNDVVFRLETGDCKLATNDCVDQSDLRAREGDRLHVLPTVVQREVLFARLAVSSHAVLSNVIRSLGDHPASDGKGVDLAVNSIDFYTTTDPHVLERVVVILAVIALDTCAAGEHIEIGSVGVRGGRFWCRRPGFISERERQRAFEPALATESKPPGMAWRAKLLTEGFLAGSIDITSTPEAGTTFNVWL